MSTYTKITPDLSANIYFLNDKNIVLSIDENISENAVPSQKLFKEKYDELSTYDSNLCAYVSALNEKTNTISCNLSGEIDSLSDKLSADLSTEIENRISSIGKLSADLSGEIDSLSAKLSADLSTEIENRISAVKNLSTNLSNTVDEKFVLKSGDLMETLSVVGKIELSGDIVVPNYNTKVTIGKATAPYDSMFVWNGTENEYVGKEIDDGKGNTFSINPNHELCGVFIGEKSLCAYITEDVELTASEIRGEINAVSTLLTTDYALLSDVNTAINRIDNAGYLISNDFKFEYKDKALWLSAGSKTISVDATDFIVDGLLASAEVSSNIDGEGDTPYLVLTFRTYRDGEVVLDTQKVSLAKVADVYTADDNGIEIKDYKVKLNYNIVAKTENLGQLSTDVKEISANHETRLTTISQNLTAAENEIDNLTTQTNSLQDYANTLSGNGSTTGTIVELSNGIKQTNEKHQQDFEYFNSILQNNATFAGTIQIDIENNVFKENDKLSALLEKQNSNSNRVLKSGDIYQIEFINNDFTDNITDPFRCEKTFYDTSDEPSVRLAHKDYIVIYTPNIGIPLTYDNVHRFVKIIPAVRFYELYQLSVTVSSDYFWLSGGNNNIVGHAVSGDNDFIGNNYFEGISTSILSANTLSVNNMSADNLSASILSANTLSAITLTANTLSVNNMSADNITADWTKVIHTNSNYSLYNLSVDLSNKIFIKNELNGKISSANLSVIKISKDEYDEQVASETLLSDNILYVVESDYIDAYGQVISNLVMTDNTNLSEATNKDYVDKIDEKLTNAIETETTRAEEAEQVNANAIAAEKSRAETAEAELDSKITAEKERAETAEQANNTRINDIANVISSKLNNITNDSQLSDVLSALIEIRDNIQNIE